MDQSIVNQEREQDALRLLSLVAKGLAGIKEAQELAAHLGISKTYGENLANIGIH